MSPATTTTTASLAVAEIVVTTSATAPSFSAAPSASLSAAANMARPVADDELSTVQAFRARVTANRQHAAEEKLRRVNRVLRRAKVSKIANALRKRLEYASFKVRHGCADKTLAEVKELFAAAHTDSTYMPAAINSHPPPSAATPPHDAYHRQASSYLASFSSPDPSSSSSSSSSLPWSALHGYPVSPASSTADKSDLAATLTSKLRAETDAYFAQLGHPPVARPPVWSAATPFASPSSTSAAATSTVPHPPLTKSTSSHFPSPAPSPILSRASSPLGKARAGAAMASAGSLAEPALSYPPDPDAEQGARLLMMMLGQSS
ncbi:hypothetical protein BDZ88DRAFT_292974 [Geranomyces variabilis]|nr:hypothetical protein BDZ88DRAFT_292974 [Geranomyces variabilis]KAJ3138557.1 hypothetical protein HDU90_000998 [Geranomyces variabilis]